jgi:hypothetical protein
MKRFPECRRDYYDETLPRRWLAGLAAGNF